MSSKECETQLNELLEAWDLDEAILNQTDIEAIKHLLLENQMQQDVIISYKITNLDQAVDIQQLEQENNQLKEELQKADSITQSCIFDGKEESTINFRECLNILKLYKEVIEEVREYIDNNTEFEHDGDEYGYTEWVNIKPQNIVFINELLQILDKVKEVK